MAEKSASPVLNTALHISSSHNGVVSTSIEASVLSYTTWIVCAAVIVVQVGNEFIKFCTGEIDKKQFY